MQDGCFGIRTVVLSSLMLLFGWLGGCKTSEPEPRDHDAGVHEGPETDAGMESDAGDAAVDNGGTDTPSLDPGEWAQLDFLARKQFMRDTVMPAIKPLFQSFDGVRFAAVSCKTCHASGAQAGTFALPNADLPVLSSEGLKNPPDTQKPILEFMRSVLKPKLAELLGRQDAADFKCTTCHTSAP